jgi:hypothetical protein
MERDSTNLFVGQFAMLPLFPFGELAPVYRTMWRQGRGRDWARKVAFRQCSEEETLIYQAVLTVYEICRQWGFKSVMSRDQDELVWQLAQNGCRAYTQGKLTNTQVLQVASILTWPLAARDWQNACRDIEPELRAQLTYIQAHRFIQKKKAEAEVVELLRSVVNDAPADSLLRRVAQAEKENRQGR